jgi:hypothetical protein
MSNYQNGTLYKIVCKDTSITDCYVGSTTNHSKRKSAHKSACNNEKNKNYNFPVYRFIRDNGGWDSWEFVLIEDYPCNKKKQLNIRERYWFEKLNSTLNSFYPQRSMKEYNKEYRNRPEIKQHIKEKEKEYRNRPENKERIKEKHKEYRNRPENKQRRKEKDKEYRNRPEIKEHIKEYNQEYYNRLENKEKHKEYRNRPGNKQYRKEYIRLKYTCNVCNCELTLANKSHHEKTQKHLRNLEKTIS